MNDIVMFFMLRLERNPLIELVYKDVYSEEKINEKINENIKEIRNKHNQTCVCVHVGISKMLKMVENNADIVDAFDEIIAFAKMPQVDVIIVDEWHLMFMNTMTNIDNNNYSHELYQKLLKVKMNELINALDDKKMIFKTSQTEHQRYVEPFLTAPTMGRLKQINIG